MRRAHFSRLLPWKAVAKMVSDSLTDSVATTQCRLELTAQSTSGESAAAQFEDRDWAIVGRSEESELELDHRDVSFRHAFFVPVFGRLFYVDLNSRSGIWTNGERTRGGWASAETPLQIGPFEVVARLETQAVESPVDVDSIDPLRTSFGDSDESPKIEIDILNGEEYETRSLDRVVTLLGCGRKCRLRFESESVSRAHCCLVRSLTGVTVYDLLGKGGTLVNG